MPESFVRPEDIEPLASGVHSFSMDEYIEDPCDPASLNASTAHVLATKSPAHAYAQHSRLGGRRHAETSATSAGTLLHNLILEGGSRLAVIEAADWRTKAAKAERDIATASGMIPILSGKFNAEQRTADAIKRGIEACGFDLREFEIEKTWLWKATDGTWRRARPDAYRVQNGSGLILDLKTTEDAAPDQAAGSMTTYGYDIGNAHYVRGMESLFPKCVGRVQMVFLFAERAPPYAVTPCICDGSMAELGARRYARACTLWAQCMESGNWPGYGTEPIALAPRGWELHREGM